MPEIEQSQYTPTCKQVLLVMSGSQWKFEEAQFRLIEIFQRALAYRPQLISEAPDKSIVLLNEQLFNVLFNRAFLDNRYALQRDPANLPGIEVRFRREEGPQQKS